MNVAQFLPANAVADDRFGCINAPAPNLSNEAGTDTMLPQASEQNLEQLFDESRIATELTRDRENRRLVQAWRSGDETARDKLIENNRELARRVASQKAWKYKRDVGEFLTLAWIEMVDAMDALYHCGHTNVGAYLTTAARRAIEKSVKKEHTRPEVSLEEAFLEEKEPAVDFDFSLDDWDQLYASCVTEKDKRIIELRSEGYTLEETAERVGLPISTVHSRLKLIEGRYDGRQAALS